MRCYPMTPEQIDLVRKSFDALWPFRRKLAELFYSRFFDLAPDTRRLFPNDMERQQLKLMDTIAAIVGTLDQREIFQSIISNTGRKHAEFGVQTSHFVAFGDALIWGLQQQFGPAFTAEMQQAWMVLYDAIQAEMMRAAKTPGRTDPLPKFLPAPPTHSRAKRVVKGVHARLRRLWTRVNALVLGIHDFVSPASEARPGTPRPDLRPLCPRAERDERRGMARGAKVRARRFIFWP